MTDTGPTDLGTITVTGQRRQSNGNFPSRGGGGGDHGGGGEEAETELPEEPETTGGSDPCGSATTAVPWNADAEGAASVGAFLQAASGIGFADAPNGQPSLGNREFGRGLARGPDNTVWGNAVTPGPPRGPDGSVSSVTINFDSITYDIYIGDAHSHPNGNPLPSQKDWDYFILNNNEARLRYGRTSETFYMYIATVDASGQFDKLYVYEDGPRGVGSPDPPRPTETGEEVNPDAQACS